MTDAGVPLTVDDLVEYCRTQARLLRGEIEAITDEATSMLDEVDADIAAARARLTDRTDPGDGDATTDDSTATAGDVEVIDPMENDLEEKQAIIAANQARLDAFQDLAVGYLKLADALQPIEESQTALTRVLEFEHEHDAPAYFDDRLTVLEAARDDEDTPE